MLYNQTNLRTFLPFILVVIIAMLIFAAWYFKRIPASTPRAGAPSTAPTTSASTDLGSTLYHKISNPVRGTLPSTLAPIPNPANSFYVNPFK